MSATGTSIAKEALYDFSRSYAWKLLMSKVDIEFARQLRLVRQYAKQSDKASECAHACGFAEGLEFVSSLPDLLAKELAKGDSNESTSNTRDPRS